MKPVIIALAFTFFAVFLTCVISLPFAWRLGSLPKFSSRLRQRLPGWLLARLEKKGRHDPALWVYFVNWLGSAVWIASLVVVVFAFILGAVGLYD